MLDIVASYHCMQFQGKPMIQTQLNGEKPNFGPDLGSLGPNSGGLFFTNLASHLIDIMVSYHHVQYQKKLMIQY